MLNKIALVKTLIVPEDLPKMAPTHQILEQLQIHRVQQPALRTEAGTYQQQRLLNQLLRMLTQMLIVPSGIT